MITVLIADDHSLIRDSFAAMLDGEEDISVVGTCGDGSQVAEMAARTEPDVLLTDLRMPRRSGLEAARAVLAARPGLRVILVSGSFEAADIREAKALGVSLLDKTPDLSDALPDLVRAVAAGHTVWHAPDRGGVRTRCEVPGPQDGVICGRGAHSEAIAHHAGGRSPEGIAWAMFWWDTRSAPEAERPPTTFGFPRPRNPFD